MKKAVILDFTRGVCKVVIMPDYISNTTEAQEEYLTRLGYNLTNCNYMITYKPIQNEIVTECAKRLINAIENNHVDLWNPDLQDTTSAVVYMGGSIGFEDMESGEETEKEYNGIYKELTALNEAVS